MKGKATRGITLQFGDYGMKALEPCWIKSKQIEAARVAISRYVKKSGKLWINIFPQKVVTQTAAETRMGKGKGAPDHWVAVVKPGKIMFEMSGVSEEVAFKAMKLAARKMPIKVRFVSLEGRGGAKL
jgi:large subunit ribosomal protein L16